MTDILRKIATERQVAINNLKILQPLNSFVHSLAGLPDSRFKTAIESNDGVNIIAEIKKGSPSKGILVEDFRPADLAEQYKNGGAAALSVLTEEQHFFGHADFMALAKDASGLPVLCKDFIIDPYQIHYAKFMKADAILLIAALHTKESLNDFITTATKIDLDCLVEAHDAREVELSLDAGATILGVNNRNLKDFSISLETSERLAKLIPDGVIKVAESGIATPEDISRLQACGFNAFLIGEALVTSEDPAALLSSLRSA